MRSANHIEGLTNEHLSYCYCSKDCCKGNLPQASHKDNTRDFMVDDMAFVAGRDVFLRIWQGQGSPREPCQPCHLGQRCRPAFRKLNLQPCYFRKVCLFARWHCAACLCLQFTVLITWNNPVDAAILRVVDPSSKSFGSSLNGSHILQPF